MCIKLSRYSFWGPLVIRHQNLVIESSASWNNFYCFGPVGTVKGCANRRWVFNAHQSGYASTWGQCDKTFFQETFWWIMIDATFRRVLINLPNANSYNSINLIFCSTSVIVSDDCRCRCHSRLHQHRNSKFSIFLQTQPLWMHLNWVVT